MTQRQEGRLIRWHEDKGYGFIAPDVGGPEVFVHISEFPRDQRHPQLGDRLTFVVLSESASRKKAVELDNLSAYQREVQATLPHAPRGRLAPRKKPFPWWMLIPLVVALGFAGHRYGLFGPLSSGGAQPSATEAQSPSR